MLSLYVWQPEPERPARPSKVNNSWLAMVAAYIAAAGQPA